MAAPRNYADELRERAVRMALDARQGPATNPGALARIGGRLVINPETLPKWVTQAEIDEGSRPGTTTTDAERLTEFERRLRLRLLNIAGRVIRSGRRDWIRPPRGWPWNDILIAGDDRLRAITV